MIVWEWELFWHFGQGWAGEGGGKSILNNSANINYVLGPVNWGVSASHLGAASGPLLPRLTRTPRELYLGRVSSCHSSFTSTFSIRSVASVVPMGAGKRHRLEARMNPEGGQWMEVLLDNHHNDNSPLTHRTSEMDLQRALVSIVLLNHFPAP